MPEMTSKERIMNAIRGKETDRTPWSPFLAYYWEHLPESERTCGQVEYMKRMGADPLLRGFNLLYSTSNPNCEFRSTRNGNKIYDTYTTKVGSLTEVRTYSPTADSWFVTGHAVSSEEDFKVLMYMMENTVVTPDMGYFENEHKNLLFNPFGSL